MVVMCVVHGCDIVVLVMCMYFVLWCVLLLIVMQSAWFIVDCVVRGCYTCCIDGCVFDFMAMTCIILCVNVL